MAINRLQNNRTLEIQKLDMNRNLVNIVKEYDFYFNGIISKIVNKIHHISFLIKLSNGNFASYGSEIHNGRIDIWTSRGKIINTIEYFPPGYFVNHLGVEPLIELDNGNIMILHPEGIAIWDYDKLYEFEKYPSNFISPVIISNKVIAGTRHDNMIIWSLETLKIEFITPIENIEKILVFKDYIAVLKNNNFVELWDPITQEMINTYRFPINFALGGKIILFKNQKIYVYESRTGKLLFEIGNQEATSSGFLSLGLDKIMTFSLTGPLQIIDLKKRKFEQPFGKKISYTNTIDIFPNGDIIQADPYEMTLTIYGNKERVIPNREVEKLIVLKDGKVVIFSRSSLTILE